MSAGCARITAKDVDGKDVKLSSLKGKVVLVNFTALGAVHQERTSGFDRASSEISRPRVLNHQRVPRFGSTAVERY